MSLRSPPVTSATTTPLLTRLPKKTMETHPSSVTRGLYLSLPPSIILCLSWGCKVSKPQSPRSPAAPSVYFCILCTSTETPPLTGSRPSSRTGSQGPTSRVPTGPAGVFTPKDQSRAPSKVIFPWWLCSAPYLDTTSPIMLSPGPPPCWSPQVPRLQGSSPHPPGSFLYTCTPLLPWACRNWQFTTCDEAPGATTPQTKETTGTLEYNYHPPFEIQ